MPDGDTNECQNNKQHKSIDKGQTLYKINRPKNLDKNQSLKIKSSERTKQAGNLKCLYTNSDSLLNKRAELMVEIELHKPDMIALCEVKPKRCRYDVQPEEIAIQGFELFHNLDSSGRGVALLVRNELKPSVYDNTTNFKFQEAIFVKCQLSENEILTVGVIYRSPNSSISNSKELNSLIYKLAEQKEQNLLIVGDFNYPEISWEKESCRTEQDHAATQFLETYKNTYLIQHQTEYTRHREGQRSSLIDLVLTNKPELIEDITTCAGLGKSDHCTLIIKLAYMKKNMKQVHKPLYHKANFDNINKDLRKIDWPEELDNLNVEKSWTRIKDAIDRVKEQYVPLSKPKKTNFKKWMTKDVLESVRKKHRAFRKSRVNKNEEYILESKKARNKSQRECRKAKRKFEKNLASQCKQNPKAFWSYAKSKQKTRSGIADLSREDGSKANSDSEKAEILNSFFQSVFTVEPDDELPTPPSYSFCEQLADFDIPEEKVHALLANLHTGKAAGPDGLNPLFLSKTADSLALPITILFRKSLLEGKIPNDWRLANVSPIFKKGRKSVPNNYRPVSLTCILCKTMEKIVREHIIKHLESNDLVSKMQHGFTSGRSCTTQLLDVLDIWTRILDEGGTIDTIYMDYQKAFDSVPHRRLISKVEAHGISGNILSWIKDFLSDRAQKVVINGSTSETRSVTSGIPQGSVLGPLLFVLYINDLPCCVQSQIRMFADDTKIFTRSDINGAPAALQNDLDQLQKWSEDWLLKFHPEKCHVMKLGRKSSDYKYTMKNKDPNGTDDVELTESEFEKDLGVIVDNKLNFKEHVHHATSKANRITGVIRRTFDYLSENMFKQLFTSLVRPILEYGNAAWQPKHKTLCQEIENVQRRATKLLASTRNLSYQQRLKKLNLPSLEHRRKRGDMIELYKYIHGIYLCGSPSFPIIKTRVTRGHSLKIAKGHHKLQLRGNFFSVRIINLWNSLPDEVVTAPSVNIFKSRLDKYWRGLPTVFDPECYWPS